MITLLFALVSWLWMSISLWGYDDLTWQFGWCLTNAFIAGVCLVMRGMS